jgi:hypothetical protein
VRESPQKPKLGKTPIPVPEPLFRGTGTALFVQKTWIGHENEEFCSENAKDTIATKTKKPVPVSTNQHHVPPFGQKTVPRPAREQPRSSPASATQQPRSSPEQLSSSPEQPRSSPEQPRSSSGAAEEQPRTSPEHPSSSPGTAQEQPGNRQETVQKQLRSIYIYIYHPSEFPHFRDSSTTSKIAGAMSMHISTGP